MEKKLLQPYIVLHVLCS